MLDVARISDLYRRIASVTTLYTFTQPVATEDIAHVRGELAAAVPECAIDMFIVPGHVHVVVSLAERRIYHRAMIIEEQAA